MKKLNEKLNQIDNDTRPLLNRINQDGYVLNKHDNFELRMRIDAIKAVEHNKLF